MACFQMHLNPTTRWKWLILGTPAKRNGTTTLFKENYHIKPLRVCMSSNSSQGQQPSNPEKLKASRSLRNNVNLRQELQDFILTVGLPSDSVPSFKELSFHGRQDLANIVRRRGYKAIAELLIEPKRICTSKTVEKKLTYRGDAVNLEEFKKLDFSPKVHSSNAPPHDNSSSEEHGNFQENISNLHIVYSRNTWSSVKRPSAIYGTDAVHMVDSNSNCTLKSSLYVSLHERAADFIRTGDFHDIQGDDESEEHQSEEDTITNACKTYKLDDSLPLTPYGMDAEKVPYRPSQCDSSVPSISGRSVVKDTAYQSSYWTDYPLSPDTIAAKKTSFWTSEVQPVSREEASNSFHINMHGHLQFNDDGIPESAGNNRTLMELQHFNSVLQLKELELAKVKRELEKKKEALYSIQAKAMAEVARAKRILSEKESELSAADQVLSDLKQVLIDYWGEGTNVEVTGSFNGWQHCISMEPDPSSEIRISKGTRGPLMWSTELWLYPGIYEIKFIVDGNWQVDSRREVVTRDIFKNNVLKVEY